MHKNLKNALLLGAVVALSGSANAFELDFTGQGGNKAAYGRGEGGALVRSNSGFQQFDASPFENDADDSRFAAAQARYVRQLTAADAVYDDALTRAQSAIGGLDYSSVPSVSADADKYKPNLSALGNWKDNTAKAHTDKTDGKFDLGDGKKEKRTFGEMRQYAADRQKEADDLLAADQELAKQARIKLDATKASYEEIMKLEAAKRAEKAQWLAEAQKATRKSAMERYVDTLDEADKDLVLDFPAELKDPTVAAYFVNELNEAREERNTAQSQRGEIMSLLVQLEGFKHLDPQNPGAMIAFLNQAVAHGSSTPPAAALSRSSSTHSLAESHHSAQGGGNNNEAPPPASVAATALMQQQQAARLAQQQQAARLAQQQQAARLAQQQQAARLAQQQQAAELELDPVTGLPK